MGGSEWVVTPQQLSISISKVTLTSLSTWVLRKSISGSHHTRDSWQLVRVYPVSQSLQLQQQQLPRCFLLGFNMSVTHLSQHLLSQETRAVTVPSIWLSARLTFCPSVWGYLEQDVALQAISSNPSGSCEEAWHPWPWKQWFLLRWNIYSLILFFNFLCYLILQMCIVAVDPAVVAPRNNASVLLFFFICCCYSCRITVVMQLSDYTHKRNSSACSFYFLLSEVQNGSKQAFTHHWLQTRTMKRTERDPLLYIS